MTGPARAKGTRHDVFVVAQPGLEGFVVEELRALGVHVERAGVGGVRCRLTMAQVLAANLRLRTATRVLLRLGRFEAESFDAVVAGVGALAWERWLGRGVRVAVSASSAGSRLYHTGAIEERVVEGLCERVPGVRAVSMAAADETGAQRVLVRLKGDVATVSLDTTGVRLHQRGWRRSTVAAPLRESLAAALVMASGWTGDVALLDPCCGSGTIPIEAALLARRMPPGRDRTFAFERWPTFDAAVWQRVREAADAEVLGPVGVPVLGSDRDRAAVAASVANAARAGVSGDVAFDVAEIGSLRVPSGGPGCIVTNPPYGERLRGAGLEAFYSRLGRVLRERAAGWTVAFVDADRELVRRSGLRGEAVVRTSNGGIPVRFVVGAVPRGRPPRQTAAS